jgi:hypothetical protein
VTKPEPPSTEVMASAPSFEKASLDLFDVQAPPTAFLQYGQILDEFVEFALKLVAAGFVVWFSLHDTISRIKALRHEAESPKEVPS